MSKLLNVFWCLELASRLPVEEVIINLINPGSVDTGLHRDGNKFIQTFDRVLGRTPEEGGRLLIDAAIVKGVETHGKYLSEAKLTRYDKTPFQLLSNHQYESRIWELTKDSVSPFVKSKEGLTVQRKLWKETGEWLKKVSPWVQTDNLL